MLGYSFSETRMTMEAPLTNWGLLSNCQWILLNENSRQNLFGNRNLRELDTDVIGKYTCISSKWAFGQLRKA